MMKKVFSHSIQSQNSKSTLDLIKKFNPSIK